MRKKMEIYKIWYSNEVKEKFDSLMLKQRKKSFNESFRLLRFLPTLKIITYVIMLACWIYYGKNMIRLIQLSEHYRIKNNEPDRFKSHNSFPDHIDE